MTTRPDITAFFDEPTHTISYVVADPDSKACAIKAPGRDDYAWETTVAEQRRDNVHVHDGIGEDAFVAMREQRDATLAVPRLILPSIQVNMRAGEMPPPEDNGISYIKVPLNAL